MSPPCCSTGCNGKPLGEQAPFRVAEGVFHFTLGFSHAASFHWCLTFTITKNSEFSLSTFTYAQHHRAQKEDSSRKVNFMWRKWKRQGVAPECYVTASLIFLLTVEE